MCEHSHFSPEEVEDYLIEVSTALELQRNIEKAFPKTTKRQYATQPVRVISIEYVPYVGVKMIHIKSSTITNGRNRYDQAIQFNEVDYNKPDDPNNITIMGTDGEPYTLVRPTLRDNPIKVRCNCLDFYYRMAAWNYTDKSIVGRAPKPYKKKTNRPPVNPLKLPGMCKHLLKVLEALEGNGFIRTTFK